MKTKCKCAAIGSGKSGLVAAIAVLAIAFVLLAAVPVAVTEGDAAVTDISDDAGLSSALGGGGGDYRLTSNIAMDGKAIITVANTVTLDLNGYTISK